MKTLYISYFGALKHLCQTQVIPYLREISKEDIEVTLLTFEENLSNPDEEKWQKAEMKRKLAEAGIGWHYLRYHKRPSLPATMFDVLVGICYASYLVISTRIDVVHARSHVPAVIALVVKRLFGVKFLFDMRGLMAEEYVDAGTWKRDGIPFKLTKWVEAKFFRNADAIVMLTHKIKGILQANSPDLQANPVPVEIIPCCVDLDKFKPINPTELRKELGLADKNVMVYIGGLGGWYLAEEMVELFATGRKLIDNFHFLVLTQSDYSIIRKEFERRGMPPEYYTITTVPVDDVPKYLTAADFAISFIKPCYSKLSSSPTKIGEYLASGLPIITNAGIGDTDELVRQEQVGVVAEEFNPLAYKQAIFEILNLLENREQIRDRCRKTAEKHFSLNKVGKEGYLRVYQRLGMAVK